MKPLIFHHTCYTAHTPQQYYYAHGRGQPIILQKLCIPDHAKQLWGGKQNKGAHEKDVDNI
jgi:hypothetical protein